VVDVRIVGNTYHFRNSAYHQPQKKREHIQGNDSPSSVDGADIDRLDSVDVDIKAWSDASAYG